MKVLSMFLFSLAIGVGLYFFSTNKSAAIPILPDGMSFPTDLPASCLQGVDDLNATECCMRSDVYYQFGSLWTKRCCQYNPNWSYCTATATRPDAYCCFTAPENSPENYCTLVKDLICDNGHLGSFFRTFDECMDFCDEDYNPGTVIPPGSSSSMSVMP